MFCLRSAAQSSVAYACLPSLVPHTPKSSLGIGFYLSLSYNPPISHLLEDIFVIMATKC